MATLNPEKSCQPFEVIVSLELLASNAPGMFPPSAYIATCACPLPVRYSMMLVTVPELVGVYCVALGMPVLKVVLEPPTVVAPKVDEEPVYPLDVNIADVDIVPWVVFSSRSRVKEIAK